MELEKLDWDTLEPVFREYLAQVRRDPVGPIRVGNRTIGAFYDINGEGAEEQEARVTRFELETVCRHWAEELAGLQATSTGVSGSRGVRLLPYATARLEQLAETIGQEKVDAILLEVFGRMAKEQAALRATNSQESDSQNELAMAGNQKTKGKVAMQEKERMDVYACPEEDQELAAPAEGRQLAWALDCLRALTPRPITISLPPVDDDTFFEEDAEGLTRFEREILCQFWTKAHLDAWAFAEALDRSAYGTGDACDYALARAHDIGEPLGSDRVDAIVAKATDNWIKGTD